MIPTFVDRQYIIVDQISYRVREPERGDVVIFKFPNDPSKYFIKRMIGLPGETVEIKGKEVKIITQNKETLILDEPYVKNLGLSDISLTLTSDEYFVMGDNRASSYDSRFWGPLPKDMLVGRALVRLLPFTSIGLLPGDYKY
jgi:signal peptidase I